MVHHDRVRGKCTHCEKRRMVTILCDDLQVCAECLETWYTQCDICGEYWDPGITEMEYVESMDKIVCEHCLADLDIEEE